MTGTLLDDHRAVPAGLLDGLGSPFPAVPPNMFDDNVQRVDFW